MLLGGDGREKSQNCVEGPLFVFDTCMRGPLDSPLCVAGGAQSCEQCKSMSNRRKCESKRFGRESELVNTRANVWCVIAASVRSAWSSPVTWPLCVRRHCLVCFYAKVKAAEGACVMCLVRVVKAERGSLIATTVAVKRPTPTPRLREQRCAQARDCDSACVLSAIWNRLCLASNKKTNSIRSCCDLAVRIERKEVAV